MDTEHLKRSKNKHILAVAVCLVVVMIVVAIAVGKGTDLFSQISVSPNSQAVKYSYDNTNIERNSDNKVIVGNTDLVIVSPDSRYTTLKIFGCIFPEFNK